jgi:hypothetical protein
MYKCIFVIKNKTMKTGKIYFALLAAAAAFMLTSCGAPITLTSWKNPESKTQVSKLVLMPMFEKLEYLKPFEKSMDAFFEKKGLLCYGSLEFLNPSIKYPLDDIKHKCDSLGADAILVFIYQGTDKTESYVPGTTYVAGGYGGYWGGGYWGGGYYGGAAYYGGTVTTEGYWTTTSVVNLKANLYTKGSKDPAWTGDITVTDPQYIDQAAANLADYIYKDWQKEGLLKFPEKK